MYDGASKIKGLMPLPSAQKFLNLFDPYFPSWQIHRDVFIFIEASQPTPFFVHTGLLLPFTMSSSRLKNLE